MRGRSKWSRLVMVAMVGAVTLAACSSGSSGSSDAPGTSSAADGAASEMDPNGVLKVGYDLVQNQDGVVSLDPYKMQSGAQNNDALWYLLYGRFLRPTADGKLEPDLAETVEVVDTGTIVIKLKPGLTFSDGSPFDAQAVKASLDQQLANRATVEPGAQPPYFDLTSVTVDDPTTLTLSIKDGKAASWFDTYIPTQTTSIAKVGATGPGGTPIGAGPFRFVSVETGQTWVLEKNPEYWNAENVNFARVELRQVSFAQAQSGLAALQSGLIDVAFTEPALLSGLSGNLDSYARTSPNKAVMLHICKAEGPLADVRVRTAINKAIDRDGISEAVYAGTAEPQHQLWPEGHRLNSPDLEDVLAFDPEGARQLLAEAGYANGVDLDLYPIQAFNIDEAAEVVQQQLADVGIKITIVPTPDYPATYLAPQRRALGMYPSSQPGPGRLNTYSGTSTGNVCQYQDPELDALIADVRQVSENSEEASELWADISDIVVNDALSGFIVWRSDLAAFNTDRIGEMLPFPTGNYLIPDPIVSYIKSGS